MYKYSVVNFFFFTIIITTNTTLEHSCSVYYTSLLLHTITIVNVIINFLLRYLRYI